MATDFAKVLREIAEYAEDAGYEDLMEAFSAEFIEAGSEFLQ